MNALNLQEISLLSLFLASGIVCGVACAIAARNEGNPVTGISGSISISAIVIFFSTMLWLLLLEPLGFTRLRDGWYAVCLTAFILSVNWLPALQAIQSLHPQSKQPRISLHAFLRSHPDTTDKVVRGTSETRLIGPVK